MPNENGDAANAFFKYISFVENPVGFCGGRRVAWRAGSNHHGCYPWVNYHELSEWAHCIVDTRNTMAGLPVAPGKVWKA